MARADTVVIQDATGFFGTNGSETAHQKVTIGEDKLKVLDEARGWALYVRLDKKTVTEAFAPEKGFVEKQLASFAEIRAQREKTRAEKVEEFKKLFQAAPNDTERANLKRKLGEMGLREDGKTLARFETFPADAKNVTVVVNGVKQQVQVTHHKVRENEGKEIFDVWMAPTIAVPAGFFKFYEELGTFSDAVVTELRKNLTGCPIEITAILDNGNEQRTLHSTIREIRKEDVAAAEYDVPASYKVLKDQPTQPDGQPAAKIVCAICGKACTPGTGEASNFVEPWGARRSFPVCSDAHRSELIKKLAAEQRKQAPK